MNKIKIIEAVLKEAGEFKTQEALNKYLKDHPDADKSKHKVIETRKPPSKSLNSKQEETIGKLKNKLGIDEYKVSDPDSAGRRTVTFGQSEKNKVYHIDKDGLLSSSNREIKKKIEEKKKVIAPEFKGDWNDDDQLKKYMKEHKNKTVHYPHDNKKFEIGKEVTVAGDPSVGISSYSAKFVAKPSDRNVIVYDEKDNSYDEVPLKQIS